MKYTASLFIPTSGSVSKTCIVIYLTIMSIITTPTSSNTSQSHENKKSPIICLLTCLKGWFVLIWYHKYPNAMVYQTQTAILFVQLGLPRRWREEGRGNRWIFCFLSISIQTKQRKSFFDVMCVIRQDGKMAEVEGCCGARIVYNLWLLSGKYQVIHLFH